MISVPADIAIALFQEEVEHVLRITWTLADGQAIDVSKRLVKVGSVSRTIQPFLAGFQINNVSVTLRNEDRFFSHRADTTSGESMISYRDPETYMSSTITIEDGIIGPETGVHYIPVFKGYVQNVDYDPTTVSFTLVDAVMLMMSRPLAEQVTVDPTLTASAQLQTLITDNSTLTSSDLDTTGTFAFADEVQEDLDWTVSGFIVQGQLLRKAVNDLARSGFGVVYPDETGLILYQTEFPQTSGQEKYIIRTFPLKVDPSWADSFQSSLSTSAVSTRITVKYQKVSCVHQDKTGIETTAGPLNRTVNMPYILFMRCARQAARVLFEYANTYQDNVNFVTPGWGLMLQVNDRIAVEDPMSGVVQTYRVMSKTWSTQALSFSCVKEGHTDTYLDETFAEWDVTSWTDASAKWW